MRLIQLVFFTALLAVARTSGVAAEGARATVHALLVVGSNQAAKSDPRLAPYEANLKRILQVESVRFVDEGAANLALPGKGAISLGSGQSLELQAEKSGGKGPVFLRVNWRTVVNNAKEMSPGVPMILVGRSAGKAGEIFAVIITVD